MVNWVDGLSCRTIYADSAVFHSAHAPSTLLLYIASYFEGRYRGRESVDVQDREPSSNRIEVVAYILEMYARSSVNKQK